MQYSRSLMSRRLNPNINHCAPGSGRDVGDPGRDGGGPGPRLHQGGAQPTPGEVQGNKNNLPIMFLLFFYNMLNLIKIKLQEV